MTKTDFSKGREVSVVNLFTRFFTTCHLEEQSTNVENVVFVFLLVPIFL